MCGLVQFYKSDGPVCGSFIVHFYSQWGPEVVNNAKRNAIEAKRKRRGGRVLSSKQVSLSLFPPPPVDLGQLQAKSTLAHSTGHWVKRTTNSGAHYSLDASQLDLLQFFPCQFLIDPTCDLLKSQRVQWLPCHYVLWVNEDVSLNALITAYTSQVIRALKRIQVGFRAPPHGVLYNSHIWLVGSPQFLCAQFILGACGEGDSACPSVPFFWPEAVLSDVVYSMGPDCISPGLL